VLACSWPVVASTKNALALDGNVYQWYSNYFTGDLYKKDSESAPVLAYSACAESFKVAELLAISALSTSKNLKVIDSVEYVDANPLKSTILSVQSGMETGHAVLRQDSNFDSDKTVCVLVTRKKDI